MQNNVESPRLLNVVLGAVKQVEESAGVAPDDPAVVGLKHSVVRTLSELEVAKANRLDNVEES